MRVRTLALVAYALLLAPVLAFFFGWLKWYIALAAAALLLGGFIWLWRADLGKLEDVVALPRGHVLAIVACFGLWVALSGICGVGVEAIDIPYRMAVLRDLISYDWPVIYEQTGYALVYYHTFWMLPALIGKILGMGAALFAIWLQETAIVSIAFLLICVVLHIERPSRLWMAAIVLVGFSGLNIIGALFGTAAGTYPAGRLTLTTNLGWLDDLSSAYPVQFMYRTSTDIMCEVYNQSVIWIAIPLMLIDRRIHSFLLLGLLMLPYSPWCTIGLAPLMVCLGIMELVADRRSGKLGFARTVRAIASPANVGAALSVGIVYALFYASASTMSTASAATRGVVGEIAYSTGNVGIIPLWELPPFVALCYAVFCIVSFGAFAIMLFSSHRRDPLFWTCIVWLALIPLVWVSSPQTRDFCMNVSMAPLTLLMIWVTGYVADHLMGKRITWQHACAWIVIVIALGGGLLGIVRNPALMVKAGTLHIPSSFQAADTFAEGDVEADANTANFLALDPDSSAFFRHLAR